MGSRIPIVLNKIKWDKLKVVWCQGLFKHLLKRIRLSSVFAVRSQHNKKRKIIKTVNIRQRHQVLCHLSRSVCSNYLRTKGRNQTIRWRQLDRDILLIRLRRIKGRYTLTERLFTNKTSNITRTMWRNWTILKGISLETFKIIWRRLKKTVMKIKIVI